MKTRILLLALFIAASTAVVAQEKVCDKQMMEKRLEFRVKKMQEKLMLDDATAEKFAPIYKEYLQEKAKCFPVVEFGKELTDDQIKKNIEDGMAAQQKMLDVDKKYYNKLSKILNAKQLQQVFCKKNDFGKEGKKAFDMHKKLKGKGKPEAVKGKGPKCGKKNAACKKDDACSKAGECKVKDECKKSEGCKKGDACKKECNKDGACKKNEGCKDSDACKK